MILVIIIIENATALELINAIPEVYGGTVDSISDDRPILYISSLEVLTVLM